VLHPAVEKKEWWMEVRVDVEERDSGSGMGRLGSAYVALHWILEHHVGRPAPVRSREVSILSRDLPMPVSLRADENKFPSPHWLTHCDLGVMSVLRERRSRSRPFYPFNCLRTLNIHGAKLRPISQIGVKPSKFNQ